MTRSPVRAAAFVDLDGTLIPGSANIPLARAAFRAGLVTPRELLRDLRNGLSFLLHGASDERSAQVRERILAAVAGRSARHVEALADDFLADLVASIRPVMRELLEAERAAGRDRVLLSATPVEIVSRLAREAGFEHGAGTRAERDANGVFTGRLADAFCYREGKVTVLRALAEQHGYDLAASSAYSDSLSDLPMLHAVGNPVVVNPEPALRELALAEGWPVVETRALPRIVWSDPAQVRRWLGLAARDLSRRVPLVRVRRPGPAGTGAEAASRVRDSAT